MEDLTDFHNERFEQFKQEKPELLKECVDFLQEAFTETVNEQVREMSKTNANWYSAHHFGWGMQVRNMLRGEGFTDSKLPFYDKAQNWDDFYIPVIEAAVGIRTL